MPDQVPVAPADGAVAAAVDPPVVAPPAPADAAVSTTHRTLTTTRFLRSNLRLRRFGFCLFLCSFSSVLASVLLVLCFRVCATSFAFRTCVLVYSFRIYVNIFASVLQLNVRRRCTNLVFASVLQF